MSNYQRLISYIYTYEGGIRGKNIGFAKLETRGNQCRITVNVKKIFVGGNPVGVYLLSGQDEVKIGTLFARNGAGEFRTVVNSADVENSGHSLEEFYGLSVHDVESAWRSYTTIWEDAVAHAAEVELADVTSEKVALRHDNSIKNQAVLKNEDKEQELLPISREIEEQVEKEAVLQETSVYEGKSCESEKISGRVYDAEEGKIVHLSSEIPKAPRNEQPTAEGRTLASGLREKIMTQTQQNGAEVTAPSRAAAEKEKRRTPVWRMPEPAAVEIQNAQVPEAEAPEAVSAEETMPELPVQKAEPLDFATPEMVMSETASPETVTYEAVIPETGMPESAIPKTAISETVVPESAIPESAIPETAISEAVTPETTISETVTSETVTPETVTSETVTPEIITPETATPEIVTSEIATSESEASGPEAEEYGPDEAIQGLDSSVTYEMEYRTADTIRRGVEMPSSDLRGNEERFSDRPVTENGKTVVRSSGMMLQESNSRIPPVQLGRAQISRTRLRQEQMQQAQQIRQGQQQLQQMRQNQMQSPSEQMRQSQIQQPSQQMSRGQMQQPSQQMSRSQMQQPPQQMSRSQIQQPQQMGQGQMQTGALRNETLKPESLEPAEDIRPDVREPQTGVEESNPPSGVTAPFKDLSDSCNEQEVWEMMRKKYPKILAFDYADGCEVLTIKPQDIGLLPREEWVYGSNSFLLHGYYNYRYLILARLNNPDGKARYLLGVPGHYLSNEKYMASMFGFSNFVLAKKQPPRDGRFGYWYTDVKIGD